MYSIRILGYEGGDFGTFESGFISRREAEIRVVEIRKEFASADDPLREEEIVVVEID